MLNRTIREIFPDVIVAPGLMVAATNSRHYTGDHRQDFPLLAGARQFGRSEAFSRHQRAPQRRGLCRHDPVLSAADRERGGMSDAASSLRGDAAAIDPGTSARNPGSARFATAPAKTAMRSHPRLRQPVNRAGRAQRVDQQARHRHLPDAAGHRRDRAGDLGDFLKGDVADQARLAVGATGRRLMPTSITVAPGLIQSPRTISGLPTAA